MEPLILLILILLKRRRSRLLCILSLIFSITGLSFPKIQKYNRLVNRLQILPKNKKTKKKPLQFEEISDIYNFCGLFPEELQNLHQAVLHKLIRKKTGGTSRKKKLTPLMRLVLILHWLKHYPTASTLANLFGISASLLVNEKKTILPILVKYFSTVPTEPILLHSHEFEGVRGAIDCTDHPRNRVHPGSTKFYRGDKHAHFLTSQMVVDLNGLIHRFDFLYGHNNDAGSFNITKMRDYLEEQNIKILGDSGYSPLDCVTPDFNGKSPGWNHQHMTLRSIVEITFGFIKCWKAASNREGEALQNLALQVIYSIVNYHLGKFPIANVHPPNFTPDSMSYF